MVVGVAPWPRVRCSAHTPIAGSSTYRLSVPEISPFGLETEQRAPMLRSSSPQNPPGCSMIDTATCSSRSGARSPGVSIPLAHSRNEENLVQQPAARGLETARRLQCLRGARRGPQRVIPGLSAPASSRVRQCLPRQGNCVAAGWDSVAALSGSAGSRSWTIYGDRRPEPLR
jgi:hypothetical protein